MDLNMMMFIHHGGEWDVNDYVNYQLSGVVIRKEGSYRELCDVLCEELGLTQTSVFDLKYKLKEGSPLMSINSDSSLRFYVFLVSKEADYTKYPVCVVVKSRISVENSFDEEVNIGSLNCESNIAPLCYPELDRYPDKSDGNINFMSYARNVAEEMVEVATYTENILDLYPGSEMRVTADQNFDSGIVAGILLNDKETLQTMLTMHAIKNQYQFKVDKSCSKQYYVRCVSSDCTWFVKASRMGRSNTFKIRDVGTDHICALDVRTSNQRQATSTLVSSFIKTKFTNNKTAYNPGDIIDDMQNRFGINLTYHKAWRSKRKAVDEVRGKVAESYDYAHQYLSKLRASNPGSIVMMRTTWDKSFMYVFMALGASVKGWVHCRPIVIVDGTFLSSVYGGILLTASCQDANSHILPLAFCVVDSENNNSYVWFFTKLQEVVGDREGLCIVSDGHESIRHAVDKVFPNAAHCLCTYHISNKLKMRYKTEAQAVKEEFYAAAKAYTVEEFDKHIAQINKLNPHVVPYLEEIGFHKWARVHCPNNRYFTMTSNVVESINAAIRSVRDLPITPLLEALRDMQQRWNAANRDEAKATFTPLTTKAHRWLETNYQMAARYSKASDKVYKVMADGKAFIVDIESKTCTCHRFQVDELPCPHTIRVIKSLHLDPVPYCSEYYLTSSMLATYEEAVIPIEGDQAFRFDAPSIPRLVNPPDGRVRPGRPRKQRFKSGWEHRSKNRCSKCHEKGHNVKTCRNPIR